MQQYSERPRSCQPARPGKVYGAWRAAARRLLARAVGSLPAEPCVLCLDPADGPAGFCAACALDLPWASAACGRCAMPLPAGATGCGSCSLRMPSYQAAFAAFDYSFPVDQLVRRLKYHGHLAHSRNLGALLAQAGGGRSAGIDGWVPVPLHREREARRGYNQALEIARELAARTDRPLLDGLLWRARATRTQAGLGAIERRANVQGAFRADPRVKGLSIGLVDDVLTTGSTADAAARALQAAGARRVEVWVVARVSGRSGRARDRRTPPGQSNGRG